MLALAGHLQLFLCWNSYTLQCGSLEWNFFLKGYTKLDTLCGVHICSSRNTHLTSSKPWNWSSSTCDYFSVLSLWEEAPAARFSCLFRYEWGWVMRSFKFQRKFAELPEPFFWSFFHLPWGEKKIPLYLLTSIPKKKIEFGWRYLFLKT